MANDHTATTGHGPPGVARQDPGVSRRSFMQTLGLSAAAGAITQSGEAVAEAQRDARDVKLLGPDPFEIMLSVNGRARRITIDPATTLAEALRLHMNLTGTKEVCDRGACGGCSVLVDGRLIAACMMLAVDAVGEEITTVEALAQNGQLDPIQESFIRHDALQCGYCTPGLIIAAKALLAEHPRPSLDQIKRGLSGNLCRCGTYTNVFNAVLDASGQAPIQDEGAAS